MLGLGPFSIGHKAYCDQPQPTWDCIPGSVFKKVCSVGKCTDSEKAVCELGGAGSQEVIRVGRVVFTQFMKI